MIPFLTSVFIASATAFLSLIIGLPLAIILSKTDFFAKTLFKYLYLVPIFIPPSIIALTWIGILGESKHLYSPMSAVIMLTLCYFPFITLLSIGGISSVGRNIEEAARLDYGNLGVLWHITIPYASKFIIAATLFVFVFAISNYEIPALLGVHTFPVEIFARFSAAYDYASAFMLSIPLVILCTALIIIAGKTMQNKDYIAVNQNWEKPWKIPLNKKHQGLIFAGISILLCISVLLPLIILFLKAGKPIVYQKAFQSSLPELRFTLIWTVTGAALICGVSFFISYMIERSKSIIKHFLYYASLIPFGIPATVVGILLIKLFNRPALSFLYTTPFILIIAYFIRFAPFSIRVLCASIGHLDKNLEDQACIDGAGFFKRLFFIVVPLCSFALIISFAIIFTLAIGELGTTILVIPPGSSTFILRIYTLMHYGASKLVAAQALILLGMLILFLGGLFMLYSRYNKRFLSSMLVLSLLLSGNLLLYADSKEHEHLYSTWETIELDTCASAWLIKKHIDKKAKFKFYPKGEIITEGIPFNTPDSELRRTANMSTFESILKKNKINDPVLIKIGEIIHDIDINYWAPKKIKESEELNQKIIAIIQNSKSPHNALERSFVILDELYKTIKSSTK